MRQKCAGCGIDAIRVTPIDSGELFCDVCYQKVSGKPPASMTSADSRYTLAPVKREGPDATIASLARAIGWMLLIFAGIALAFEGKSGGLIVSVTLVAVAFLAFILGELLAIRQKLEKSDLTNRK